MPTSPFLQIDPREWVASNELAFAVRDKYPVTPGHTLIIPRRMITTWFDATPDEQRALFALVDEVKAALDRELGPDGYNVGFNAGEAAGQTVMHLHVHVIPRHRGDVEDPRGGVRGVIPARQRYGEAAEAEPAFRGPDPSFVEKVLALLDQGQFTATYKFAVLTAMMDLCLEHTTAHGSAPVTLTTRQLAERVIELYWRQTVGFGDEATVLRQNSDPRSAAKILSLIHAYRAAHAPDPSAPLGRSRRVDPEAFERLVRDVEWTLVTMPLPRLQRIGRGEDRFLYDIRWTEGVARGAFRAGEVDNQIHFAPGAADQLAALAPVLRPMVQRRWAAKVSQLNSKLVPDSGLEAFLFGVDRNALVSVRDPLRDLQQGRCFYCDGSLKDPQVDHFVAWSRHADDGIDNLVLADARCNGNKSDHLAAAAHVERWLERSRRAGGDLQEIARRVDWARDAERSQAVARGIYLRLRDGVALWRRVDDFEASRHADMVRLLRSA